MLTTFLIAGFLLATPTEDANGTLVRQLHAEVKLLKAENARLRAELATAEDRPKPSATQPTAPAVKTEPPAMPGSPLETAARLERQKRIALIQSRLPGIQRRYRTTKMETAERINRRKRGEPPKHDPLRNPYPQPTEKDLARQIRDYRAELKRLRNPRCPFVLPQFEEPLAIGQAANVDTAKVIQVLNTSSFLAEIALANRVPYTGTGGFIDHRGRRSSTISYGYKNKQAIVYISGITTRGITNDIHYPIKAILRITGTKTYANPMGSTNTVFVLEPDPLSGTP